MEGRLNWGYITPKLGNFTQNAPMQQRHLKLQDFHDFWHVRRSTTWGQKLKCRAMLNFEQLTTPNWGRIHPKYPQSEKDTQKRTIFMIFGM